MLSPQIPSEGSGVCVAYYNRGQALYLVYRVTIQGQVLTETKEREFHMGEAAEQEYFQKNVEPAWTDISDHNPLTSTMVRK